MDQYEVNQNSEYTENKQAKKILNKIGLALFVTSLSVLLSQVLIEFLVKKLYPAAAETDWYVWGVTAISMVGIALPLFWLLMKLIPDTPKGEVVKLKPGKFIMLFFICTAAMYITNMMSSMLTLGIAYLKGEGELFNPVADAMINSNLVIATIYASIVAPVTEELIFRKLLLDKLRRFGDIPAILMTGIAFGLFHMNLSQMFYAAVLGFIFAYITIRTNTIRYAILLHVMVNFIGTMVSQTATLHSMVITILIGQWVFGSIIAGIIFFIINLKKIKLIKGEYPFVKKSAFLLNPGAILYILVCTVMIVVITLQ